MLELARELWRWWRARRLRRWLEDNPSFWGELGVVPTSVRYYAFLVVSGLPAPADRWPVQVEELRRLGAPGV